MKGKPKFKHGDTVCFIFKGEVKKGIVYIIDEFGCFSNPEDVCYDILIEDENMIYKHIPETMLGSELTK